MPPTNPPPETPPDSPHIGTLNEAPLHAALKAWYAAPDAQFEAPLAGYVIDIVQGGELVEIQTGSFARIRRKLAALTAAGHAVRLVYPVAYEKWIVKLPPESSARRSRRRSPRRGSYADVFRELVSFPRLLLHPNLTLEVALIREEEIRRYDGKSWRRRGWRAEQRLLLEVVERRAFTCPADLVALLPPALADPFTVADVARALGVNKRLAGQVCYCLREMDGITQVGKQGRAYLYRRS
ncbi:MAG: hypothetical protein JXN59_16440 [Anaerolineae bacterium]|nr:hypothetical protein [Anaerolineae bacterium]